MAKKTMGKSQASSWWAQRHKILASIIESKPTRPKMRKVKARNAARKAARPKRMVKAKKVVKTKRAAMTKKVAKPKKSMSKKAKKSK